jgi:putative transposase
MAGLIRDLKKFEEFLWLKAFDSAASQQVDLDVALKNATMIVSGASVIPIVS